MTDYEKGTGRELDRQAEGEWFFAGGGFVGILLSQLMPWWAAVLCVVAFLCVCLWHMAKAASLLRQGK
jgi:hypothetical protein